MTCNNHRPRHPDTELAQTATSDKLELMEQDSTQKRFAASRNYLGYGKITVIASKFWENKQISAAFMTLFLVGAGSVSESVSEPRRGRGYYFKSFRATFLPHRVSTLKTSQRGLQYSV